MNFEDFIRKGSRVSASRAGLYTLRMFWRRWRKKADVSIFGKSVTPSARSG
jgi:hypothetical protein